MVRLCLMASHGYLPGLVSHQEQVICRVTKDCHRFLPSTMARQEIIQSGSLNLRPQQCEAPWNPISGLFESNQFVNMESTMRSPVLIDVQANHPDSVLFSFGIAEQCTRHEKILQFLMSGSSEIERSGVDLSLLSDLMGRQALEIDVHQKPFAPSHYRFHSYDAEASPFLIYPSSQFHAQQPLLDFLGDLARNSKFKVHPDGRVSFTGTGTEMKDILSVVAEFYLLKNSTKRKQSMLVPHFIRLDNCEARANVFGSSLTTLETVKVAPLKSPEKVKLKPPSKKKNSRKALRERDLYKRNYFHACESLLSLMVDKRQHGKTAILSLKKSGPELPELLTQFSASIAGTGIAVLFSVICKVGCGRVPFCASKLYSTGFGFGLVWLSWAVNKLRDTIIYISKNSGKMDLKEEEMMRRVDRSLKEIFFRAATVMAVAVLRLA
ncbi:hypothetical protein L1049_003948 [Liquidambar formosana]|uniref:Uncharacterized protein n=1 Tax=Liquidambar formosana TaxID=63359 RepID=A0AAP0RT09_LIQFO